MTLALGYDDWRPRTLEEMLALDQAEVLEGYEDDSAGEPEPGDNRTAGYRQGWRAGERDAGRIEPDGLDREQACFWLAFLGSPESVAWLRGGSDA